MSSGDRAAIRDTSKANLGKASLGKGDLGEDITRHQVARSAGLALVSRLGVLIEIVAQPIYTWLFGIATYGLYAVLWAAVNIVENIVDLAMTSALQRVVPTGTEADAHAAVKFALAVSVIPATLIAALVAIFAEPLAGLLSVAPEDRARLPLAIALFAPALPLWTFLEVATSAVRARRAFGPEIRLRIFWEQIARLAFAVLLFGLGLRTVGLMLAHLASLLVTAALSIRLLSRYYDLRLMARTPIDPAIRRALLASGFSILPSTITKRLFSDLPTVILNLTLPGAGGATAAGLFTIARKISSIPLIVRQAFHYVLEPLTAAQSARDRASIGPLYRFAARASVAVVVPIGGLLILTAPDILSFFDPAAAAALPLLVILVAGRTLEAMVGPATPVVEMTGHRGLPVLNSVLGLAVWAALSWMLVPTLAGTGMAIAVAVGTVVIAWAAAVELRITDGLSPFDAKLAIGLAVALAGLAGMAAIGATIDASAAPGGARARALMLLLLFPLVTWLSLRFGLARSDRAALGGLGRWMRLSR